MLISLLSKINRALNSAGNGCRRHGVSLLIGTLLAVSLGCNLIFYTYANEAYSYILRWRHSPYNFVYDVSVMIEFCEYEWENYK
jgi:hypothetical protein